MAKVWSLFHCILMVKQPLMLITVNECSSVHRCWISLFFFLYCGGQFYLKKKKEKSARLIVKCWFLHLCCNSLKVIEDTYSNMLSDWG